MSLGTADIAVLVAYFVGTVTIGLWFGRGERDTTDFFLGGRRQHWLVVGLSIIATEVSALTFLIVPGRSYEGNWWYLQMYVGSFVGRLLIVYMLLPAFYGGSVTTVYEYLGQRFGPWTRTVAALMFFASRIIGSGIRLLAASLALAIVFDWPLAWVVVGAAAIAVTYTTFGGIKAIIWTDAFQALVFAGAAVAVVVFLLRAIPGAWIDNLSTLSASGKLQVFHWEGGANNVKLFWVLMISSTVQTMAALGADQDMTQRMLTCPDLRRGQRSLIFNAFLGLPVVCVFLLVGSLVHQYYAVGAGGGTPVGESGQQDRIFAHFIATALPVGYGLKGLLVAGIFAAAMSSLDSALGALSSSAVTDFYRPIVVLLRRRFARAKARSSGDSGADDPMTAGPGGGSDDRCELRVARACTIVFGVLLAWVALAFADSKQLLEDAFGWVGLIFGGMLGVFVLGVTTTGRGGDRLNVFAMLSSVGVLIGIKYAQERSGVVYLAWPWWVVVGTTWTYLVGVCCPTAAVEPRSETGAPG